MTAEAPASHSARQLVEPVGLCVDEPVVDHDERNAGLRKLLQECKIASCDGMRVETDRQAESDEILGGWRCVGAVGQLGEPIVVEIRRPSIETAGTPESPIGWCIHATRSCVSVSTGADPRSSGVEAGRVRFKTSSTTPPNSPAYPGHMGD